MFFFLPTVDIFEKVLLNQKNTRIVAHVGNVKPVT